MSRTGATALILMGATFMSFVGLLMRLIDSADGYQILTYRSISLAGMVAVVACLRRRVAPLRFLASLGRTDAAMGLALALAFATYVFAMLNTSVASTLFILSLTPLCTAVLAWIWIKERPSAMTFCSMALAGVGVWVMVRGGLNLGQTFGNLLAFASAVFFAIMLVLARRSRRPDVLGGTFLGGVFCCAIGIVAALGIGNGLAVSAHDFWMVLAMGGLTIGIGIACVTWGSAYLPAAETSLLVLIESVLGPIWVWVFVAEAMTAPEMLGGGIVLAAVAAQALVPRLKAPATSPAAAIQD